jgi:ketosteroid isomerase-like protein
MDDTARTIAVEMMVKEMNRCWTAGWHEKQFRQFIHPDAVAVVPTTPGRLEGRDAYLAGWRSFSEAAVIHEWKETGHKVQLYNGGKCAVVTYFFSITFAMGGQAQTMQGRDMFFLVKEGRKWLVVADQFSPEPAGL